MKMGLIKPTWLYVVLAVVAISIPIAAYFVNADLFFPVFEIVATAVVASFGCVKMEIDDRFSVQKIGIDDIERAVFRYVDRFITGNDGKIIRLPDDEYARRVNSDTSSAKEYFEGFIYLYEEWRDAYEAYNSSFYRSPAMAVLGWHVVSWIHLVSPFLIIHFDSLKYGSFVADNRFLVATSLVALYLLTAWITYVLVTKDLNYIEILDDREIKGTFIDFRNGSRREILNQLRNETRRIQSVVEGRCAWMKQKQTRLTWVKVGYAVIVTVSLFCAFFN